MNAVFDNWSLLCIGDMTQMEEHYLAKKIVKFLDEPKERQKIKAHLKNFLEHNFEKIVSNVTALAGECEDEPETMTALAEYMNKKNSDSSFRISEEYMRSYGLFDFNVLENKKQFFSEVASFLRR